MYVLKDTQKVLVNLEEAWCKIDEVREEVGSRFTLFGVSHLRWPLFRLSSRSL